MESDSKPSPEDLLRKTDRLLNSLERNYELLQEQSGSGSVREQLTNLRIEFGRMTVKLSALDGVNLGIMQQEIKDLLLDRNKDKEKKDNRSWQLLVLLLGQCATIVGLILTWFFKH